MSKDSKRTALSLLQRAALVAEAQDLPTRSNSIITMLALAIIGIVNSSPEEEAERLAAIAAIARGPQA